MSASKAVKETLFEKNSNIDKTENKSQSIYINLYFFQVNVNLLYSYFYLITSILMNIINRILYQKYDFKFNFTLLLIQQLSAIIFFNFIFTKSQNFNRVVGKCSFKEFNDKKYKLLFVAFLFLSNLLCSFLGNQKVNTVMFLSLRKFLLIMNYLYDLLINKKTLPGYFFHSVIFIVIGSFLNAYDDFSSELIGYILVMFNNILSVLYAQRSESFSKINNMSILKLLVYISYISVPALSLIVIISGEYEKVLAFKNFSLGFFFTLSLSCSLTMALNISYFVSIEKNSSLFTQILANSKDIFISVIAFFVLGDFQATLRTIIGFTLSTLGALLFSVNSIWQNIKKN